MGKDYLARNLIMDVILRHTWLLAPCIDMRTSPTRKCEDKFDDKSVILITVMNYDFKRTYFEYKKIHNLVNIHNYPQMIH